RLATHLREMPPPQVWQSDTEIEQAEFSPDGRFVKGQFRARERKDRSSNTEMEPPTATWDLAPGRQGAFVHRGLVAPLFSPDSRTLVLTGPRGLELRDPETGAQRNRWPLDDSAAGTILKVGGDLAAGAAGPLPLLTNQRMGYEAVSSYM